MLQFKQMNKNKMKTRSMYYVFWRFFCSLDTYKEVGGIVKRYLDLQINTRCTATAVGLYRRKKITFSCNKNGNGDCECVTLSTLDENEYSFCTMMVLFLFSDLFGRRLNALNSKLFWKYKKKILSEKIETNQR